MPRAAAAGWEIAIEALPENPRSGFVYVMGRLKKIAAP